MTRPSAWSVANGSGACAPQVGHLGLVLLDRDDGGIAQRGIGCPVLVHEPPLGDRRGALGHPLEAAPAPHPLEPVPDGGGGGEGWQVERLPEGLVLADLSDILNGLAPKGVQEFGVQGQATAGGDVVIGPFQLERQDGLSRHGSPPSVGGVVAPHW